MKNQHIVNIKETLLFLSICRHTLCEMYDNKDFKKFIVNEASNYQILNIIVNNEIPEEEHNIEEEIKQWEIFQQIIAEGSQLFVEMGPIDLLQEVGGDQGAYAQGLYDNMKSSMKAVKSSVDKQKNSVDLNAPLDKIAVGINAGAAASIIKFAAAKAYKEHLAKINMCKGRPDKVDCIKRVKDTALNMRIEKLRSGMSLCNKAKNSDACKKSLQKQITRLQTKSDQAK